MSTTLDMPEVNPKLWELFLSYCRAEEIEPTIKGYFIWLEDQDLDDYEPDWDLA